VVLGSARTKTTWIANWTRRLGRRSTDSTNSPKLTDESFEALTAVGEAFDASMQKARATLCRR